MIRAVLSLTLLSSVASVQLARGEPSHLAQTQSAPPLLPEPNRFGSDFVGFDAFAKILEWLRTIPAAFDSFVTTEKRSQLGRTMRTLADAFGRVNQECISLARLVDRSDSRAEHLEKPFDALVKSIVALRKAVLGLASDLGSEVGERGSDLAFQLAKMTEHRANVTEEARKQVLGGERGNASKKLRHASELAEEAQKLAIGFIQDLKK
jgi:hypothetical protein